MQVEVVLAEKAHIQAAKEHEMARLKEQVDFSQSQIKNNERLIKELRDNDSKLLTDKTDLISHKVR